jgi:hypothetical protein
MTASRHSRVTRDAAATSALGVVALIVLAVGNPATDPLFPPCLWWTVTGWLCPGCGSARALHALLHGHVSVAWHENALAVATMPILAIDLAQRLLGNARSILSDPSPRCACAIAFSIVMFGVLRNV